MTNDLADLLARTEPTNADLARLHADLVARATTEDLLDIAYRTVDSPVGDLLVAATPVGLVRVAFEHEGVDAVLGELSARVSPRILDAPGRLDDTARQLDEYFAGRRHHFGLPLDLSLSSGFRRAVLGYLPDIDYGHTASYAQVAAAVDNPKAVRAVGTACATNPLPLVIPCHRVVRSDGQQGAYRGGPEAKALLLHLEATS